MKNTFIYFRFITAFCILFSLNQFTKSNSLKAQTLNPPDSSTIKKECPVSPSCAMPEANKFDFLLGKWKLTWNDTLTGIKTVTKELDGCAVYENYIDDAKTGNYKAISYTAFNQWAKYYSQTMIDNKGIVMISKGEWKEDRMLFVNSYKTIEGKTQMFRQIYYNIQSDTMDWDWESSTDEGKSWKKEMTIHYKRI